MGFTKDDLQKIYGLTDEQVDGVLKERGKEVEAEKKKLKAVQDELDEKKKTLDEVNKDFEDLKKKELTNEEYKSKFETLQKEVKDKEEKAKAEKEASEKAEALAKRYEAVAGEKKWTHEAIKADYMKKFETALSDKENEGKSDVDIFNALTKDDKTAFEGVVSTKIEGAKPIDSKVADDAKVRAVMGLPPINKE